MPPLARLPGDILVEAEGEVEADFSRPNFGEALSGDMPAASTFPVRGDR
jgi:hypothetical protein